LLARGELITQDSSEDESAGVQIDDALAAFGLYREDDIAPTPAAQDDFHLWPEHLSALRLWGAVQTQWRHGFAGATGLDYAGVGYVLQRWRAGRSEADRLFGELQIMERATLIAWAERRAG